MRWAAFGLAVAAALSATAPAVACKGKNVLFQDSFNTANPGWGQYDKNVVKIGGGSLDLTPLPGHYGFAYYRGDVYQQADACVDAVAGAGSAIPDGEGGLVFGDEDYIGLYFFWVSPKSGTVGVLQWAEAGNQWTQPMVAKKVPAINTSVGGKNTLRVVVDGTRAMAYVNDQFVVQLTTKTSKVGGIFGLGVARVGNPPDTWAFSNFKITDLP
jgi:hypothetical protein